MPDVKTVGIITKPNAETAGDILPDLLRWLKDRNIDVRCDHETAGYVTSVAGMPRSEVPDGAQLIVLLGGDGTLLSAARAIGGREIPLFAVNLGGLGFLTAITVDGLFEELDRALRGEHRIGRRRYLECELQREGATVSRYEALNDVVIDKVEIARMIEVEARVDDQFVCSYRADGLIIATPTGSTAYSLSAGGPIIFPSVAALAITPICPHTLTNRPVVVADTSVITLVSRAKDHAAYLTIDGQIGQALKRDDMVICRRSEHALLLVRPPWLEFFDVLRQKLKWG